VLVWYSGDVLRRYTPAMWTARVQAGFGVRGSGFGRLEWNIILPSSGLGSRVGVGGADLRLISRLISVWSPSGLRLVSEL